jgi:hypothetical protein
MKWNANVAMARYNPRNLRQGIAIIRPLMADMHPAKGRDIQKGIPNLIEKIVEA